jgi:hypothetical protein
VIYNITRQLHLNYKEPVNETHHLTLENKIERQKIRVKGGYIMEINDSNNWENEEETKREFEQEVSKNVNQEFKKVKKFKITDLIFSILNI